MKQLLILCVALFGIALGYPSSYSGGGLHGRGYDGHRGTFTGPGSLSRHPDRYGGVKVDFGGHPGGISGHHGDLHGHRGGYGGPHGGLHDPRGVNGRYDGHGYVEFGGPHGFGGHGGHGDYRRKH